MNQITVTASVDQVQTVIRFVKEQLEELGCFLPLRVRIQIEVVIDEVFSNIVYYAYSPGTGTVTVGVEVEKAPPCVSISFMDHGRPFNPLIEDPPDVTRLSKMERQIGGLGLFMVKRLMTDVSYEFKDGQNILTIRRKILGIC